MSVPSEIAAAVKMVASLLPELVAWMAAAIRGGRDPEAELRLLMASAEESAREHERRKFGQ